MKEYGLFLKHWILFSTALLCLCLSTGSTAAASDIDVSLVVHPGVPVDNLSMAEVRKILLGDRQFWSVDLRVVLLIRAPVTHERDVVLKKIYQMSESQFRHYWIGKVFRGETTSGPKLIYSDKMATELTALIPGGIAFVGSDQIPKVVKVLKVDGRLPGETGYPLR